MINFFGKPAQQEYQQFYPVNFLHLSIQRSELFTDNRLEGIFVDVCIFGGTCKPCGVVTKTDLGKTSGVYCLGGLIEGNEIQLTHSYERLQFCELEAFGKKSS